MGVVPEQTVEQIRSELESRGLVLLDLKSRGERGSTVIEVVVDAETRDVTIDELTEVNRWTGALLDEIEDRLPSRYRLEVSTGGLDRPLEHLWQFRKNVGRLLKLSYRDEGDVVRSDLYRLQDVAGDVLLMTPKARKKGADEPISVPVDRITRAVVEPEF